MVHSKLKSLRSLKKGTKFKSIDGTGKEIICIAWDKRGSSRDILIEGKEGVYSQRSDDKVLLVVPTR